MIVRLLDVQNITNSVMPAQGVELVEQPIARSMLEETRWAPFRVHLPIIADEACLSAAAIPKL